MLNEIPNLRRAVEDDPCFPIYGEIIRMLENDMTVEQAIAEHCDNFKFGGIITANDHDLWHIVLAMAELKMGQPITNLNFGYNNNGISEYVVNLMQQAFDGFEKKPAQLDAYKSSYRAKVNHAFADQGDIDKKIDSFRRSTGVYKLNALFPLLAAAKAQTPPLCYFEYLLNPEMQKGIPKDSLDVSAYDESLLEVMERDDLRALFELTMPVIEFCLDKLEKQSRKSLFRMPKAFCENRNEAIKNIKLRDLWNLMPVTRAEPAFSFSRKQAHMAKAFRP